MTDLDATKAENARQRDMLDRLQVLPYPGVYTPQQARSGMADERLVEAVARAINPVLSTDNDIYWEAEYGRPIPQSSLDALATAAIEAMRVYMGDDGNE